MNQSLVSLEGAKIRLYNSEFNRDYGLAFILDQKMVSVDVCSCCRKTIRGSVLRPPLNPMNYPNQPCTLVNINTKQLACYDDETCENNSLVHVYHWWCLTRHLQIESSPSCTICHGNGTVSNSAPWKPDGPVERLGVDIGGVIVSAASSRRDSNGKIQGSEDTSFFGDNFLGTPPEPGCIHILRRLVSERFGTENVFLISKSQPQNQIRTMEWLKHINFFERTGILEKNVFFCTQRCQKKEICERLGINHFIDDRLDVLESVVEVSTMQTCLLYSPQPPEEYAQEPLFYSPSITKCSNWEFVHVFFLTRES